MFKEVNQPEVVTARIGQMLDELKMFRGVSTKEFSKAVGVSGSLVYMLRRGESNLTVEVATKIEKAYPDYPAAWLLGLWEDRATDQMDALRVLNKNVEKITTKQRKLLLKRVLKFIESELLKSDIRYDGDD